MNLYTVIYLIDNLCGMKGHFYGLDNYIGLFAVSGSLCGVAYLFSYMVFDTNCFSQDQNDINEQKRDSFNSKMLKVYKTCALWSLPFFLIGSLLNVVIPSKETAYKMLAAYGVQETVLAAKQSEYVQRMTGKSLQLLEKTVDKYLSEEDNVSTEAKQSKNTNEQKEQN